jgi:hypothetical protein
MAYVQKQVPKVNYLKTEEFKTSKRIITTNFDIQEYPQYVVGLLNISGR